MRSRNKGSQVVRPANVNLFEELEESFRSSEFSFKVVDVTADIAAELLGQNSQENRNLQLRQVEKYKGDMLAGLWKLTHQGVCIDEQGTVIDGQHRLTALVEAEEENIGPELKVPMLIVRKSQAKIADPIDRGTARSVQFLTKLSSKQVTAVNCLRMLETGESTAAASSGQALEVFHSYKNEFEYVGTLPQTGQLGGFMAAVVWVRQTLVTIPTAEAAPTLSAMHSTSQAQRLERFDIFARSCLTGEGLFEGDPAFAFRKWKERPRKTSLEYNWHVLYATLTCARFHMAGRKLHRVFSTSDNGYRAWVTLRRALKLKAPSTSVCFSKPFFQELGGD